MAYPEDEENGARGLPDPNAPYRVEDTKTGNIINYAPGVRVPLGAASSAAREARITAAMPDINIPKPPNLQADKSGFTSNLDLSRYKPQAVQMQEHEAALHAANEYLATMGNVHKMREETAAKLDSADFLQAVHGIDHASPDYERQATKLFADYPRASGAAVENALGLKNQARANYLHGTASGGAEQFAEGSPERDAYEHRYAQTKNPLEAKAHAENTQKGEEALRVAVANDFFDLNHLNWKDGKPEHPEYFTAHGTPNYHAINLAVAKNAADINGKAKIRELADDKRQFEAAKAVHAEFKGKAPDVNKDPQGFKRFNAASAILNREMRGTPEAAAAAAAALAGAPAAAAPVAPATGEPVAPTSASKYLIK